MRLLQGIAVSDIRSSSLGLSLGLLQIAIVTEQRDLETLVWREPELHPHLQARSRWGGVGPSPNGTRMGSDEPFTLAATTLETAPSAAVQSVRSFSELRQLVSTTWRHEEPQCRAYALEQGPRPLYLRTSI